MKIWVDADACPVVAKEILFRAADRTGVQLTLVANQPLSAPMSKNINTLQVPRGFDNADDEIVKRLDPPESTKLEGVVEAKVDLVSVTILGITYPIETVGPVSYEDENGVPMSAVDFFNAIVVGTSVVELEDNEPDGDADELEFDD